MPRTPPPVSSFGVELQTTLREGANRRLEITFDTSALATRFSQRINSLRAAMKREKHPDWEQLYRCGVHIDKDNPKRLIIAPRDSEFRTALAGAGLDKVPEIPSVVRVNVPTPPPGTLGDPAESFLATLTEATTIPPRNAPPLANSPPEGEKKP